MAVRSPAKPLSSVAPCASEHAYAVWATMWPSHTTEKLEIGTPSTKLCTIHSTPSEGSP